LKHRSKEEIAALVLEAIVNTDRPTQTMIMYKAYLTHVQLKEFLASLMEKGLIQYHKLERIYTINREGYAFLRGVQSTKPIANKQYPEDHHLNRITNYRTYRSIKPTIF
jgi:predicted transcriptional regulator